MKTSVKTAVVRRLLDPFFQAQQIIARLLRIKPQKLTRLSDDEQQVLLSERVAEAKTTQNGVEREVRLLAVWSADIGYRPWFIQPRNRFEVASGLQDPSWAEYLSDTAKLFPQAIRYGWALFSIDTVPEDWAVGPQRQLRYVLVPLIDCVHQYAEMQTFTQGA